MPKTATDKIIPAVIAPKACVHCGALVYVYRQDSYCSENCKTADIFYVRNKAGMYMWVPYVPLQISKIEYGYDVFAFYLKGSKNGKD